MEPPTSLVREWGNGLKRRGGGSRCGDSGRCGDAVGRYNALDGVADSAPGALPPGPRQGDAPLEPPGAVACSLATALMA